MRENIEKYVMPLREGCCLCEKGVDVQASQGDESQVKRWMAIVNCLGDGLRMARVDLIGLAKDYLSVQITLIHRYIALA